MMRRKGMMGQATREEADRGSLVADVWLREVDDEEYDCTYCG